MLTFSLHRIVTMVHSYIIFLVSWLFINRIDNMLSVLTVFYSFTVAILLMCVCESRICLKHYWSRVYVFVVQMHDQAWITPHLIALYSSQVEMSAIYFLFLY